MVRQSPSALLLADVCFAIVHSHKKQLPVGPPTKGKPKRWATDAFCNIAWVWISADVAPIRSRALLVQRCRATNCPLPEPGVSRPIPDSGLSSLRPVAEPAASVPPWNKDESGSLCGLSLPRLFRHYHGRHEKRHYYQSTDNHDRPIHHVSSF